MTRTTTDPRQFFFDVTPRGRGRPVETRTRILNYWRAHGPCSIMEVCRGARADRRYVQRLKNIGMLNLTASPA